MVILVDRLPDELHHQGLHLRCPIDADIDWVIAACQDPEIPRFTRIPHSYGGAEGRAFLERAQQGFIDQSTYQYVIIGPDDVGYGVCGLYRNKPLTATTEVGYWLRASARGKGVATTAVAAVAAAAIQAKYERIAADLLIQNVASQRVLERVGFTFEGTLRSVFDDAPTARGPHRIDLHLYSLLQSDLAAGNLRLLSLNK